MSPWKGENNIQTQLVKDGRQALQGSNATAREHGWDVSNKRFW